MDDQRAIVAATERGRATADAEAMLLSAIDLANAGGHPVKAGIKLGLNPKTFRALLKLMDAAGGKVPGMI